MKIGLCKFCGRQPLKNLLSSLLNTLSQLHLLILISTEFFWYTWHLELLIMEVLIFQYPSENTCLLLGRLLLSFQCNYTCSFPKIFSISTNKSNSNKIVKAVISDLFNESIPITRRSGAQISLKPMEKSMKFKLDECLILTKYLETLTKCTASHDLFKKSTFDKNGVSIPKRDLEF